MFNEFYSTQKELESKINALKPSIALEQPEVYREVSDLSHEQARQLHSVRQKLSLEDWNDLIQSLHGHPFHKNILLQSSFIRNAFVKKYGYAGDKDLMMMICNQTDYGASNYSILKNRVYLQLPAAEAVRQRVNSLYRLLTQLPAGTSVLNLACGPALELSMLLQDDNFKTHQFDLIDHDINTIRYVNCTINNRQVYPYLGNALRIIKGDYRILSPRKFLQHTCKPSIDFTGLRKIFVPLKYKSGLIKLNHYDLIYSAGLFDYIRSDSPSQNKGASALVRRLFDCLKPGGQLIIGNYLSESDFNLHKGYHRTMMEAYSEWILLYRTSEEIIEFTSDLPSSSYSLKILNEYFEDNATNHNGVIGFLVITKN